jgi:hypothetical protein
MFSLARKNSLREENWKKCCWSQCWSMTDVQQNFPLPYFHLRQMRKGGKLSYRKWRKTREFMLRTDERFVTKVVRCKWIQWSWKEGVCLAVFCVKEHFRLQKIKWHCPSSKIRFMYTTFRKLTLLSSSVTGCRYIGRPLLPIILHLYTAEL